MADREEERLLGLLRFGQLGVHVVERGCEVTELAWPFRRHRDAGFAFGEPAARLREPPHGMRHAAREDPCAEQAQDGSEGDPEQADPEQATQRGVRRELRRVAPSRGVDVHLPTGADPRDEVTVAFTPFGASGAAGIADGEALTVETAQHPARKGVVATQVRQRRHAGALQIPAVAILVDDGRREPGPLGRREVRRRPGQSGDFVVQQRGAVVRLLLIERLRTLPALEVGPDAEGREAQGRDQHDGSDDAERTRTKRGRPATAGGRGGAAGQTHSRERDDESRDETRRGEESDEREDDLGGGRVPLAVATGPQDGDREQGDQQQQAGDAGHHTGGDQRRNAPPGGRLITGRNGVAALTAPRRRRRTHGFTSL